MCALDGALLGARTLIGSHLLSPSPIDISSIRAVHCLVAPLIKVIGSFCQLPTNARTVLPRLDCVMGHRAGLSASRRSMEPGCLAGALDVRGVFDSSRVTPRVIGAARRSQVVTTVQQTGKGFSVTITLPREACSEGAEPSLLWCGPGDTAIPHRVSI